MGMVINWKSFELLGEVDKYKQASVAGAAAPPLLMMVIEAVRIEEFPVGGSSDPVVP